jgi:hypothetical protein
MEEIPDKVSEMFTSQDIQFVKDNLNDISDVKSILAVCIKNDGEVYFISSDYNTAEMLGALELTKDLILPREDD